MQVCAIRVTRLSALGVPMTGATDGFVAKAPLVVKTTPDREAGVELKATNGCGTLCGYYQAPDQLKKYNVNFELCELDHELIELLTDSPLVVSGADTIGHTSPRVAACSDASRNGVAVEFWTKRWDACGPPTDGFPYFHWFWPWAILQQGEQTNENDFTKVVIEGYLQENPNFDFGAWADMPWAGDDPLEALYGVHRETALPTPSTTYEAPS